MTHIKRINEMTYTSAIHENYNKNKLFYCLEPNPNNEEFILRLSEDEDDFLGIGYTNTEKLLGELQEIFTDFNVDISDMSGIYTIKEKDNTLFDIYDSYDKIKEIIENNYPDWTEYFDSNFD